MIMMAEHATSAGAPTHGFEMMLAELEGNQLMVQLVPCRRPCNQGGCYRVAVSRNADWYSKFCDRHLSGRERARKLKDTKIKRRNVVRLLNRLIDQQPTRSKYAEELRKIAGKYHHS